MKKLAIICLGVCVLLSGCSPKLQKSKSPKVISADERLEYDYAFTEATKQFVFGNIKQALVLYQKCIEVNPESAASFYQLSVIFTNVGELDRAIRYAKKATEIDQRQVWYKLNLANLYKSGGKNDSATFVFEDIVKRYPDNVEYKFTLANLYAEQSEYKKALEILNKIEENFGITEQISISKHRIYTELGKEDLAEDEIKNLIKNDPENVIYYGMLAEFYSERGMDAEAEEIYEHILELDDNNAIVYFSTAEHYNKKGDYQTAFKFYKKGLSNEYLDVNEKVKTLIGVITNEQILKLFPEEINALINELVEENSDNVRVLTLRADYYVRINKLELAESDLEKVLEKEKGNYVIWEQLLYIKNALQQHESLLRYSMEAEKLFPGQPTIYLFKGLAEMQLDNHNNAVDAFKDGLSRSGENTELKIQFLSLLGDSYRDLGNNQKSDEAFEKVLELDPDNMLVLNNYSYYLSLRKERLEIAEEYSRRTVEKEPENATFLDTYAWILYNMGKLDEALTYIKKAYENGGSENAEILEHYGDILYALGKTEKAVLYWKAASMLDEENDALVEKIMKHE